MSIEVIDCAQGFNFDGEIKTTEESSNQAHVMPTRITRCERTNKFKGKMKKILKFMLSWYCIYHHLDYPRVLVITYRR